jgi:hypothetical protein
MMMLLLMRLVVGLGSGIPEEGSAFDMGRRRRRKSQQVT